MLDVPHLVQGLVKSGKLLGELLLVLLGELL